MNLIIYITLIGLANSILLTSKMKTINSLKIINKNFNSKKKIGLLFFTGFGKTSQSYEKIANKIGDYLNKKNISSEIIINDYFLDTPIYGKKQTQCISEKNLKELNNVDSIFFIGHSAGSYFLNDVAKKYGDGFIQLGSVLNSNGKLPWEIEKLNNYSIPVLTLLGDKDGYINPLYSVDEMENLNTCQNPLRKPIIIEKNINHLHMADGVETKYAKLFNKKDINTSNHLDRSHEKLSETIGEFILCCIDNNYKSFILLNKIKNTKQFIMKYKSYKNNIDKFAQEIQHQIIDDPSYNVFNKLYIDLNEFVYSKPKIENNNIYISSYVEKNNFFSNIYSDVYYLKFKNNENHFNPIVNTKILNEDLFHKILFNIKSKEEIDNGPKVIFNNDKIFKGNPLIGPLWIKEPININYNKELQNLQITCPVLITSKTIKPDKYAGLYYMKLLSPQLCFELINRYF